MRTMGVDVWMVPAAAELLGGVCGGFCIESRGISSEIHRSWGMGGRLCELQKIKKGTVFFSVRDGVFSHFWVFRGGGVPLRLFFERCYSSFPL